MFSDKPQGLTEALTSSNPDRVRARKAGWTLVAAILLAAACSAPSETDESEPAADALIIADTPDAAAPRGLACGITEGHVSYVIDGDTFDVLPLCEVNADCAEGTCYEGHCTQSVRIRMVAINAGEIPHGDPEAPHHCLGDEARDRLSELILGRTVQLEFDPIMGCLGSYGRSLAYVLLEGELVQARLVEEGLVCLYWYVHHADRTRTLYFSELDTAEYEARDADSGIWSPHGEACEGLPVHHTCLWN